MQDAEGPKLYCCFTCRNQIALYDDIFSKNFHGKFGRAFLFSKAKNVMLGEQEDRQMITGLHRVADVMCSDCGEYIGWKYLKAYVETMKFKEGMFLLEKSKIAIHNF